MKEEGCGEIEKLLYFMIVLLGILIGCLVFVLCLDAIADWHDREREVDEELATLAAHPESNYTYAYSTKTVECKYPNRLELGVEVIDIPMSEEVLAVALDLKTSKDLKTWRSFQVAQYTYSEIRESKHVEILEPSELTTASDYKYFRIVSHQSREGELPYPVKSLTLQCEES